MANEDQRADAILEGMVGGALITDRDKSTVLRGFCCGKGFPKQFEGQKPHGHYTFCPVWERVEQVERERKDGERVFPLVEQPKILGDDPEVAAEILGMEPEEMEREERRFAEKHPHSLTAATLRERDAGESLGSEVKTGVEAMEEVANDDEWKESK